MALVYDFELSGLQPTDADDIVVYMADKEIYNQTLRIPYPYKYKHASEWIEDCLIFEEENGYICNFAVRLTTGKIIGIISFHLADGVLPETCEFGYWLAKAYWNKGIMTAAVQKFCKLAKRSYPIKVLTANVFAFNIASQKVLLKAGFTQTESVPGFYNKNGTKIDGIRFIKEL